jgi:hypothetical protein
MRYLVFFLYVFFSPIFSLADEKPEPVKVYCFSETLEAGFKDGHALFFCTQLSKQGDKKKSLVLVDSKDSADVMAQFMNAEEFAERGEATYVGYGLAWTPSTNKNRRTAIIKVGDFIKPFSGEGINAQAAMSLVRNTEKWIRENRDTILEKANKK